MDLKISLRLLEYFAIVPQNSGQFVRKFICRFEKLDIPASFLLDLIVVGPEPHVGAEDFTEIGVILDNFLYALIH